MATVQKRGEKWYAIYKSANGKWKQQVGFSNKAETLKLAQKLEDDATKITTGMVDPVEVKQQAETRRDIDAHVAEYETHLKSAGREPNHVRYTIADIRQFIDHTGAKVLANVDRVALDGWVVSLKADGDKYAQWVTEGREGPTQGQPNSPKTINRRIGSVQSFMKWATINGKIAGYTLQKYAKQTTRGAAVRTSRALTVKEVSKLLEWCKVNCPARHDVYRFALFTGLRANEIAELPVSALDLKRGILTVCGKDTRNTNRVDTVPIHADLVLMLKKATQDKAADEKVFALPDHAAETLRRDCEAAGVKANDVSFHGLRHTFITRLAEAGVHPATAMKLARHKSLEMTLQHYTHLKTSDEQAALKMLK